MKSFLSSLLLLLLVGLLSACNAQPPQSSPTPTSSPSEPNNSSTPTVRATPESAAIKVESISSDELGEQGGGGCGMTLWDQAEGVRPTGLLFFNNLRQQERDEFTLMKIDGEFVRFKRTAATGQEFYGQQTSQTFVSEDGTVQLQVDVTLGQPGEIESVAIEQGTIQVWQNGQTLEIAVRGDAGC